MIELKMPIQNAELIERVNEITPYEISRSTLVSLFGKSTGNNVTSIVSKAKFNEWYGEIQSGKLFHFTNEGVGKTIPLSYSIEGDDFFKFINFTIYDKLGSSFSLVGMTLSLEINSNNVYLDTKAVFAT